MNGALRTDIYNKCQLYGIMAIENVRIENGCSYIGSKIIEIPRLTNYKAYAIALHEIGHIIKYDKYEPKIMSEVNAWLWAMDNAFKWTKNCNIIMKESLGSYMISGDRRMWKPKEKNHIVYRLMK